MDSKEDDKICSGIELFCTIESLFSIKGKSHSETVSSILEAHSKDRSCKVRGQVITSIGEIDFDSQSIQIESVISALSLVK